jgi:hypothetical protein
MADPKKRSGTGSTVHLKDLEEQLNAVMRALGLQIPTTDDEVRHAEIELAASGAELPAALRDPSFLYRKLDCDAALDAVQAEFSANDQTVSNLARAAREGGDISETVETAMRRDRQQSERQADVRK